VKTAEFDQGLVGKLLAEIKARRPVLPEGKPDLAEHASAEYEKLLSHFSDDENSLTCYRGEELMLVRAAVLSRLKWKLSEEGGYTSWNETLLAWTQANYERNLDSVVHVYEISGTLFRDSTESEKRRKFCDGYFRYLDWLGEMAGCYSNDPPSKRVLNKIRAYPLPLMDGYCRHEEAA
jgi:hypothetical protein